MRYGPEDDTGEFEPVKTEPDELTDFANYPAYPAYEDECFEDSVPAKPLLWTTGDVFLFFVALVAVFTLGVRLLKE